MGIGNPITFADLWKWYERWSGSDLPTWKSRRALLTELFEPVEHDLREYAAGRNPAREEELTGWPRVDRCLDRIRKRLEEAETEEDFQGVGHLCREALISLAQAVYEPERHGSVDAASPSDSDAKRQLDAYISLELSGRGNEEMRANAKGSVRLADAVQHRRTATFRDAALCSEGTRSVVNVIAIIAGRRDP